MPVAGIDFGTTTTLWAERDGAGPARMLPIGLNNAWMPTLVSVTPDEVSVGEAAETMARWTLIRSIKTCLLRGEDRVHVDSPEGYRHSVEVDEVVGHVLTETRKRAEAAGARPADRVRMGCPAIWTAEPRLRLARLAAEAGLAANVDDMLDEPIAAGVSWVMNSFLRGDSYPEGRVLVFDYGGGTLDIALLQVERGPKPRITVLSAWGHDEAGDAIDGGIEKFLLSELALMNVYPGDFETSGDFLALVRRGATRLKETLTARDAAETPLGGQFDRVPALSLTRETLESLTAEILDRAYRVVVGVLRSAELHVHGALDHAAIRATDPDLLAGKVTHVLLAGGMSRSPIVQSRVAQWFPAAEVFTDPGLVSPEESVVSGLTFDEVVSDLNLHRPAFSFEAKYVSSRSGKVVGRQTLYEAFEPLYEPHELATKAFGLGHRTELRDAPGEALEAIVTCHALDGSQLPLMVGERSVKGLRVEMGHRQNSFNLFVDGRIMLRGKQLLECEVRRWPVIRSGHKAPLALQQRGKWSNQQEQWNWWVGGE